MSNSLHSVGQFTYGAQNIKLRDFMPRNQCRVSIGKFCSIAEDQTFLLNPDHRLDWITTYPFGHMALEEFPNGKVHGTLGHPLKKENGDIKIGNDVWLGMGCTVFGGVTVGDGAIIAARSLVKRDVPPYAIYGGVPAKLIRYRFSAEAITRLLKLSWWNLDNAILNQIVPLLQNPDIEKSLDSIESLIFPR